MFEGIEVGQVWQDKDPRYEAEGYYGAPRKVTITKVGSHEGDSVEYKSDRCPKNASRIRLFVKRFRLVEEPPC